MAARARQWIWVALAAFSVWLHHHFEEGFALARSFKSRDSGLPVLPGHGPELYEKPVLLLLPTGRVPPFVNNSMETHQQDNRRPQPGLFEVSDTPLVLRFSRPSHG